MGRVIGDSISVLIGAGMTVEGLNTMARSIAAGAAATVCSGGVLAAGGVAISIGGAAAGAAAVLYGGNVIFSSARNFSSDIKKMDEAEGAGKAEKVIPNPFGKSGGPAHQGKIQDIAQEMRSKGYDISFEQYVKTPGGNKSSRYGDILVTNPQTGEQWIVQVGKQTKAGNPVSRELKAIEDLQNAGWRVDFNPYN